MNQLTEALDIAATEHRHDFVCEISAQFVSSLERQGFSFFEVLDGLTNYAFLHSKGIDTVCYLTQASLAARDKHHG
ncbi:MAG: hypothetical protein KME52_18555 [Desmonostoc geniculatum HA4340-LM1]|jgi:hypothetical protein|nr:hypothetical protein [Desmonostoc geniculatum HA4340-LM1]